LIKKKSLINCLVFFRKNEDETESVYASGVRFAQQLIISIIEDGTNYKERFKQLEFLRDCWLNLKSEVTIVKKDQDPNDLFNVSISPVSSLSNSIIENVESTTSTIVIATTSSLFSQNIVATTSDVVPKSIFKNNAKEPKETTVKLAF
jgi:hypothetical protein